MSNTNKGWLIILLAFVLSILVDYVLRMVDGDITTAGLSVEIFWLIVLVPTLFAFKLFIQDMLSHNTAGKKIAYIMLQMILIFVLFAAGSYLYVVLLGIDAV